MRIKKNKKGYLNDIQDTQKVTGVLAVYRSWEANILCLAESQVAWRNKIVRDKIAQELRSMDRYAGMVGSSLTGAT